MADFSATNLVCTFEEWVEALECIVELNSQSFDITEQELTIAYNSGKRVDDFFYDEWGDY